MLSYLLSQASEVTNIKETNDYNRDLLVGKINRAAREIYDMNDVPGSIWEQYYNVNTSLGQITLPWYVGQLRGIRATTMGAKITMHDMRPRFHATPWRQQFLEWIIKGTIPLMTPLTSASQITATLGAAEAKSITVNVTGTTSLGAYMSETLTFNAGELTKTTTSQFSANDLATMISITKSAITISDVTITQAVGNLLLTIIPARLTEARNQLIQVHDFPDQGATITGISDNIEVLYKKTFIPFYYDHDQFVTPDLDDAIIWKLREHWYSLSKDEYAKSQSMAAAEKCALLLGGIIHNQESSQEKLISVAPDRFALDAVLPIGRRPFNPLQYARHY